MLFVKELRKHSKENMREAITQNDFDFEYTGSSLNEKEAIANNYTKLTGKELHKIIVNKKVKGDYTMGFKFIAEIYENEKVEGINNVGSFDFGIWAIDMKRNTLMLKWNYGWINTITHAFEVNGNIEFYDVDTGNWRTTFKIIESLK